MLNENDFHDVHRRDSKNKYKPQPIMMRFDERDKIRKLIEEEKSKEEQHIRITGQPIYWGA